MRGSHKVDLVKQLIELDIPEDPEEQIRLPAQVKELLVRRESAASFCLFFLLRRSAKRCGESGKEAEVGSKADGKEDA